MSPIAPNPVRGNATFRFVLPKAGPVNLAVYDLQGRRVASLLNHDQRPAGWHEVPVRAAGWRQGFYFLRLEANGASTIRKFVVLE